MRKVALTSCELGATLGALSGCEPAGGCQEWPGDAQVPDDRSSADRGLSLGCAAGWSAGWIAGSPICGIEDEFMMASSSRKPKAKFTRRRVPLVGEPFGKLSSVS